MKGVLIYNPKSGKSQGQKIAIDFQESWQKELGTSLELEPTSSIEQMDDIIKAIDFENTIAIFLGGDGTFSEAVNSLFNRFGLNGEKPAIGFLPAGSGNSFLKDFELHKYKDAEKDLLKAINAKKYKYIDSGVLEYNEYANGKIPGNPQKKIFINIWGIGLVSSIAELAMKLRFFGKWNYTIATIIKTFLHRPFFCQIKTGKSIKEEKIDFITVSNSRYTGGDMKMAPDVKLDDGNLFFVKPQIYHVIKLLSLFPKIFDGSHILHKNLESGLLKEIQFVSKESLLMLIDGELVRGFNPKLSVIQKSWKFFTARDIQY